MKKSVLSFLFFIIISPSILAQISMIGTALPSELDMAQFNLYEFQQQATFTTGTIKFRQGHTWTTNWGNTGFPSGVGVQDGADIPVTAGTYIVSFNSSSGAYNFVPTTPTPVVSIVGSGVNGWPPDNIPEITLSTIDGITFTINNLVVSNGFVKFRKDLNWDVNWGSSTFPSGTGTQDGPNIPTVAGTYNVTINISNGTYTFIGTGFPSIGIWGPAVDSQNGYGGEDVDMTTTDGINYTLSGFYFSSGNAYFRQDNTTTNVWGSTAFPTGTAVLSGPSLFIPGGEWFVTFNRITGAYSFSFPSIGILGSALGGFGVDDTDLATTDGFYYSISNLQVITGGLKFRKDNSWTTNWGSTNFPIGTGTQDGPNIPITAGFYNITFERTSGDYSFTNSLSNPELNINEVKIYPNPSKSILTISYAKNITEINVYDTVGKTITIYKPNSTEFTINTSTWDEGIYFVKISSGLDFKVQKIIKN
jgi:starch-binding outer membrane protein SusE/F